MVVNILRYLWRTFAPAVARGSSILGWAQQVLAVVVALVAFLGWTVPTDSPWWWIAVVSVGLAVLFGISGFVAYHEANRPFPRITIEPGTVTYDSKSNQVWIRDMYVTNQEPRHRVALSFRFSAWTETPEGLNHLYLFRVRNDGGPTDPLNLDRQSSESLVFDFAVSGDVGDGPSGYTLTVLERVTHKMIFVAPFPQSYPPTLRDKEKPRKAQRQ